MDLRAHSEAPIPLLDRVLLAAEGEVARARISPAKRIARLLIDLLGGA